MAAYGLRPCVEIQFARLHVSGLRPDRVGGRHACATASNGQFIAPIVVRMPTGGGIFGGQTHSQSPGGVVHPRRGPEDRRAVQPYDAKGQLIAGDRGPTIR
jgi:2-oxoisovalerate dehydrogenase E1 component beta subunit